MNAKTRTITLAAAIAGMGLLTGAARANLFVNPSFETVENTVGSSGDPNFPTTFGDWGGDNSRIVTAENGITPFDQQHMLKFLDTNASGPGGTVASQVWQLVDMSPYAAAISSGTATAVASVYVNRVAGNPQTTGTAFAVNIAAQNGTPANFPTNIGSSLANQSGGILTDSNTLTWELVSASMPIPVGTTYLAVQISANENILNNTSSPEFDGHYADLASVDVQVPEPNALSIAPFALFGLSLLRRRR